MPEDQVIRLNTLTLRSVSTSFRPMKRRVFTPEQWDYLSSLPDTELFRRIGHGYYLIKLLHNPAMLNMTQARADEISSNLHYQIDEIERIIRSRGYIPLIPKEL